jgi:ribonuclease HI
MDRNEKQITLLWIPEHMGTPGNEQADEKAKAALIKNRNDKDQKRAMEKRKHNNMKGRKIEHEYDG